MRIILLRSTAVMPDPPVEKMANALITLGHKVKILAWDRDNIYRERTSRKRLTNGEVDIIHFGIPAEYSGGLKNLKALALFELRILWWLMRHHNEYDAIHAFDFDTGFAAMPCCRIFRKKLIYEIMKEKGLTDVSRVGLYGLTYKENVDDMRESPTLQLLESQDRHLAPGLKVYDPFITHDVVANQYHSLDAFLHDIDLIVIMVKHNEIKEQMSKLAGKTVLDCQNICNLPGVYHL